MPFNNPMPSHRFLLATVRRPRSCVPKQASTRGQPGIVGRHNPQGPFTLAHGAVRRVLGAFSGTNWPLHIRRNAQVCGATYDPRHDPPSPPSYTGTTRRAPLPRQNDCCTPSQIEVRSRLARNILLGQRLPRNPSMAYTKSLAPGCIISRHQLHLVCLANLRYATPPISLFNRAGLYGDTLPPRFNYEVPLTSQPGISDTPFVGGGTPNEALQHFTHASVQCGLQVRHTPCCWPSSRSSKDLFFVRLCRADVQPPMFPGRYRRTMASDCELLNFLSSPALMKHSVLDANVSLHYDVIMSQNLKLWQSLFASGKAKWPAAPIVMSGWKWLGERAYVEHAMRFHFTDTIHRELSHNANF